MAIQVLPRSAGDKPHVPAFFMVRQPILDRHQEAVAFDLSFSPANNQPGADASGSMIDAILAHFAELDMLKVVGELRGVVDLPMHDLMSDVLQHIPRAKFIFNLGDRIAATGEALERLKQLAGLGFMFALDGAMEDGESQRKLMPLAEVIRFDLRKHARERLVQLTSQAPCGNKKLLAVNVDMLAQFEACLALGFDYVQGEYFTRPAIDPERALVPSQAAIIEIIALISSDADSTEIESRIKRDVSLGLNLLRLVNSAAVGTHRIESLRQAVMVLGRKQLASWLQVMLYTQARKNPPSVKPLLMMATTRGKLLELIALRHRPGNRGIADAAFMVGIMSLMDTLFGMPMAEIVRQMPVVEEIAEALLERCGYYGDLLALAEATERPEGAAMLLPMLEKFHMDSGDLYLLQTEAFEWSNNVTQAMLHD